MRQHLIALLVAESTVVYAGNIHKRGETVRKHAADLVHSTGDRSRRILTVADVLKEGGCLVAHRAALGRNLVADAPHHHRRGIPERMKHIHHISFRPFVEEPVIAILALGVIPLVERLDHHHKAHLVA